MSKRLKRLLEEEGTIAVLRAYGLDQVITDQDDPQLWASVLVKYWPAPSDPVVLPETLQFGVGRTVRGEDGEAVSVGRNGMEQIEVWCFERVDDERLRVVECKSKPSAGMLMAMAMMEGGDLSKLGLSGGFGVTDYIDISRPSKGEESVLVHKGVSMPPNAGEGKTCYWERGEGGEWRETEKVFSRWLS